MPRPVSNSSNLERDTKPFGDIIFKAAIMLDKYIPFIFDHSSFIFTRSGNSYSPMKALIIDFAIVL